MKKKISKLIALLLSVYMALSLVACGEEKTGGIEPDGTQKEDTGKNTGVKTDSESKEIIYWNIDTEGLGREINETVLNKFHSETKSGYTVKNLPTQDDPYKQKLVIAMSSGECPDMYSHWSGGPMHTYIDSGFAQPIDDLFNASEIKDKLMEAAVAQATYKGHIYAIPYRNVCIAGIFYNKEMFKKYGLSEPKTLSELENICDVLKENGIIPFALANASKWTGSMYFMCLAARYGGLEPFEKAVAGEGKFTEESFIKAGEKIQEWVKAGYFPDGVNSLNEDDGQAAQLMYQEKAAMLLCGSWYTGTFPADSKEFYEKVDWFSFPAIDGSDADSTIQIGTVGDQFVSFNCKGEKLKAAFECAEAYLSDENIDFLIQKGLVPPVKGVEDKIVDPVSKKITAAANSARKIQLWYDQYLPPSVGQAHLDGLQEVFGLTKTPMEAQEYMQQAFDEYQATDRKSVV